MVVPRDRTRGKGHKPKHGRFPLNVRKHFFTVRVSKRWHRFPREVMESPSLEIFKSCLDTVLGNWLEVALVEQGAWTRSPPRSLPTSTVLGWKQCRKCRATCKGSSTTLPSAIPHCCFLPARGCCSHPPPQRFSRFSMCLARRVASEAPELRLVILPLSRGFQVTSMPQT